jgi:transcriptional regulator with XRE-family HTH domain
MLEKLQLFALIMPATKHSLFGQRLAAIRKARGLSQRDLAAKVGMSNRMIAYYEAQTERPPATKLTAFSQALKVSADELLGVKSLEIREPKNPRLWKRLQVVEELPAKAQKQVMEYIHVVAQANNLQKQAV